MVRNLGSALVCVWASVVCAQTPLMDAARAGDAAAVRRLVHDGARVRVWGQGGLPSWDVAPAGSRAREELLRQRSREIREFPAELPPAGISIQGMRRMVGGPMLAHPETIGRLRRSLRFLEDRWMRMRARQSGPAPTTAQDGFARSLGRDLYALDLALFTNDSRLLEAIAADLETKAADCGARDEGLGGDVKVTLRTVARSGEVRGWRLTYVERFLWDLRDKVASFDTQWHECSRLSEVVDEPVAAGNYAVVAIAPDARRSEPKMIEVASGRPAVFEVVVP